MTIRVIDFETCLFRPGVMAPEAVCMSFAAPGEAPGLLHVDDPRTLPLLRSWLTGRDTLVGAHIPYDLAVMGAKWPELVSLIFAKFDRGEITDVKLRQQLLDIAAGQFRGYLRKFDKEIELEDGTKKIVKGARWHPHSYDLDALIFRASGRRLDKNTWRLRYGEFLNVPVSEWPEGACAYPIEDAVATLEVFLKQEEHVEYIPNQWRATENAWALHLTQTWGLRTDPARVACLLLQTQGALDEIEVDLVQVGLVRPNGSRNVKAARQRMVQVCAAGNIPIRLTDKGSVCLDADACEESDDELLKDYAELTSLKAVLAKDIPVLQAGVNQPVHTSFGLAASGRSTSSKPNVQNPRRLPGIREAWVPREGNVYAIGDFSMLELHTLAQVCISLFGESKLGEALNAGLDVHLAFGAEMLGISYEEAQARMKAKDPAVKNARQAAKPCNFGYPGGLGKDSFRQFAKKSYGVEMTEEQAIHTKELWLGRWPEVRKFFKHVAELIDEDTGEGVVEQLFSKRWRGGCHYTAACNTYFQGLGADAAKRALYLVQRACYAEPTSVLYGSRCVNFVHDEVIMEVTDDARAHDKAIELGRLMRLGADEYLPDVPSRVEPILARCWSKSFDKPMYDENKRLVPWESAA